ncbi:hypothetical protein HON52_02645 [Candidatus Uhrbacteria bacterium]|jgi:hypothetical protein|nr:hypothetical protein [Candidatus Uhrbacteria bacterium]
MNHPHQSYLDQFKFAVDKLVPLTPPEIIEEAKKLHQELSDSVDTTSKQIHQALTLIGRKELPYRKAYEELCAGDEEQRLQTAVFDRLEDSVKRKVQEMTKHGVILEDYIKSPLFEDQLTADERYQVTQAILLCDDILDNQCDERAHSREKKYEDLVEHWTSEAARLQALIDRLRAMGQDDKQWKGEIDSVADRLEEGWSVVERDPSEEEIVKEMEYWNTVLNEVDEG